MIVLFAVIDHKFFDFMCSAKSTFSIDKLGSRGFRFAPTFASVDPADVKAKLMSVLKRLTNYTEGELLSYFVERHSAVQN